MGDTATPSAMQGIVTMSDGSQLPVTYTEFLVEADGDLIVRHDQKGTVLIAAAGRWDSLQRLDDEETEK